MKKIIEIIYDGMNSKYGFNPEDYGLLVVLKKPDAGTLRVMVTDIDPDSLPMVLSEWKQTWNEIGDKVKDEITRKFGESIEVDVIDEVS